MNGQLTGEQLAPAPSAPFAVVVPTLGRESLARTLASLAAQRPAPAEVVVVDDRPVPAASRAGGVEPERGSPVDTPVDISAFPAARVLRSGGRGPAAARNVGWRATTAPWVVTVDDDVVVPDGWSEALAADLAAHPGAGAVSGRIVVPPPAGGRRATDWERVTGGLQDAWWATADMAFARAALDEVRGFDERFPRAYREDADLAMRLEAAGWQLHRGRRSVLHPVRPASRWVSVRTQRGNADDALMRAVHGRNWRERGRCYRGRLPWHVATTVAGLAAGTAGAVAAAGSARGRSGGGAGRLALASAALWAGLTADFARRRIAPGPRTPDEVATMVLTSVAIPPAAVLWRLRGAWRWRRGARPWQEVAAAPGTPVGMRRGAVRAVLFDRDGTLVHDVPYNGDPALVRPVDGAREALDRVREAGLRVGLVSNQSGVARGLLTADGVHAVNQRLQELLGPFDTVQVCPHGPEDGCGCRKPAPGMVLAAARELGVDPSEVVVVGDIGADVGAARAAGAAAVLVPTRVTRPEEVAAARRHDVVAADLVEAVELVLGGRVGPVADRSVEQPA